MRQQAELSAHHSKMQLSQSITLSGFLKATKITSHPITHMPVLLPEKKRLWINLVDTAMKAGWTFSCGVSRSHESTFCPGRAWPLAHALCYSSNPVRL